MSYKAGRWMRRNRGVLVPACVAVTLSTMAVLVYRHFAVEVPAAPPARRPSISADVRKPTLTNSLGMKFLPVPGTDVLFCIHETRQQDYAVYAAAVTGVDEDWKLMRGPFGNDYPVSFINWDDARQFCAWLSRKEGKAYRLPTDHEWSLAAGLDEKAPHTHESLQAGPLNTTHYPWNGRFPPEAGDGNYAGLEWLKSEARHHVKAKLSGYDDGFMTVSPVMSFRANPFGLYDMGGNLAEMCVFPPDAGDKRAEVLRGAYFYTQTTPENLLSSCRVWPDFPSKRASPNGFRVVLDVNASPATGVEATSVSGAVSASSVQPPLDPNHYVPVQFEFPPPRTAGEMARLSVTNSLGMKFLPVTINGGTTDKQQVLFSIWVTRVQDYQVFAEETKRGWPKPFFEQGANHPAVNVSWDDANAFCAWLTEKERKAGKIPADQSYRLPSDREWSCAAGIGELEDATRDQPGNSIGRKAAIYPWGAQATIPDHVGNYLSVECAPLLASGELSRLSQKVLPNYRDGHATTAPVGSYPPNHLGLHDVGGNVWQWMADKYPPPEYKHPPPGSNNQIVRGGSWTGSGLFGAVLTRRDGRPYNQPRDDVGFRVVLAPGPPDPRPPGEATKNGVTNSLGMKFLPVPGTDVLFCIHETRRQDYASYAAAVPGVEDAWQRIRPNTSIDGSDHPVSCMSWADAQGFCAWLTKKEGRAYRLPSDHEWSLAAGLKEAAPLTRDSLPTESSPLQPNPYPWHGRFPPQHRDGNYANRQYYEQNPPHPTAQFSRNSDGFHYTAPVMHYNANPLGLYDMGGNVSEWCVFAPDPGGGKD